MKKIKQAWNDHKTEVYTFAMIGGVTVLSSVIASVTTANIINQNIANRPMYFWSTPGEPVIHSSSTKPEL